MTDLVTAAAPAHAADPARPYRIVILGGGFAGVETARALARLVRRRRDIEIELLSEENYFLFQPLLPEVAAGGIDPNHVVNPIRELVPDIRFRWCRIEDIACDRRQVLVTQGEGRDLVEVPYDHLVFALGKIGDVSSMPGVEHHALTMKDLADAFALRNQVLRCLELAAIETDPDERRALLTFAVAGGGFSGVETVGELSEMLRRCLSAFPTIDPSEVRICLIHSRDRVLPEMAPELGEAAVRILKRHGIEMILGTGFAPQRPTASIWRPVVSCRRARWSPPSALPPTRLSAGCSIATASARATTTASALACSRQT